MDYTQEQDIKEFATSFLLAEKLKDATFLITGVTGLIGSNLAHCLLSLKKGIKIIAPVRNATKAYSIFSDEELDYIEIIKCDIAKFNYSQLKAVDYIIHCAAPTASKFFVEYPVETFNTIIDGTKAILEYARTSSVNGLVYLSSLEVYGEILDDSIEVTEDTQGHLDNLSVRSSYPMAKKATETLCSLYAAEYNVPVRVARLTQTTGAGISKNDMRVITHFSRCAAIGDDIVLHTAGDSARSYCYTTDAISAILYILLNGENGEAYNVANDDTYISIRDLAFFIRDNFNDKIEVRIELNSNMGYAPTTKLNLSTKKLRALGWEPKYGLKDMIKNLINSIKDNNG